jgi:hypothetical protein
MSATAKDLRHAVSPDTDEGYNEVQLALFDGRMVVLHSKADPERRRLLALRRDRVEGLRALVEYQGGNYWQAVPRRAVCIIH